MSETKFTPGPWDLEKYPYNDIISGWFIKAAEDEVSFIRIGDIQEEADAHLIAAAPELYEALDEIINYFGGADHALDDPYVMKRVRVSLAKARGESWQS